MEKETKNNHINHIKGIAFGMRERWQTVNNLSNYKELQDLPKKKMTTKSVANWETLIENSQSHKIKPFVKYFLYYLENAQLKRLLKTLFHLGLCSLKWM